MKINNLDSFIDFQELKKKITKKYSWSSKETAVITGGCGRIGSIFTSLFLLEGLNVVVLSRSKKNYNKFIAQLDANYKKKIIWKKFDLRKNTSVNLIAKYLKNIKITHLVNNAAFSNRGKFFKYDSKILNKEIWGTFAGSMFLTEKLLPKLRKCKKAKIIFTSSLWGIKTPRFSIYKDLDIGPSPIIAAGKAAILQYAKFLAEREAVYGITVNSLLPGWFPRKGKVKREDYIRRIKKNIPLKRIGNLNDLVSAIDFLISNNSSYVTGHELIVDGGYSLS